MSSRSGHGRGHACSRPVPLGLWQAVPCHGTVLWLARRQLGKLQGSAGSVAGNTLDAASVLGRPVDETGPPCSGGCFQKAQEGAL